MDPFLPLPKLQTNQDDRHRMDKSRVYIDGESCSASFAMAHDARKATASRQSREGLSEPTSHESRRPHRPAALALLAPRGIDGACLGTYAKRLDRSIAS
jgi:hypothetical protein